MKVGDAIRFLYEEPDESYEAHIISVNPDTVPPLVTVEVHFDTCVVLVTTTTDDAEVIPGRLPASTSGED